MEDEEGYAALNIQSRKERRQEPQHDETETRPRCHYWYQIIAGAGGAVILLLIGAAIALRIYAFQRRHYTDALEKPFVPQGLGNVTDNKSSHENIISRLQKFMCKSTQINLTENLGCKLCPENWLRHENKCYWISKVHETWERSHEDCRAKASRMLVIQKQEEVAFIQNINEEMQLLWIGLKTTFPSRKWIWEDGSLLDDDQSKELGPAETNNCGMLNGNKIIAETCSTVTSWICETNVFDISSN